MLYDLDGRSVVGLTFKNCLIGLFLLHLLVMIEIFILINTNIRLDKYITLTHIYINTQLRFLATLIYQRFLNGGH